MQGNTGNRFIGFLPVFKRLIQYISHFILAYGFCKLSGACINDFFVIINFIGCLAIPATVLTQRLFSLTRLQKIK